MTSHGIVPRVLSNHCDALLRNGVPTLLACVPQVFGGFLVLASERASNIGIINGGAGGGRLTQQRVTINQSVTSSRRDLDEIVVVRFFFFCYTFYMFQ